MRAERTLSARARSVLLCAEGLLLAGGVAALLYCANAGLQARAAGRAATALVSARGRSSPSTPPAAAKSAGPAAHPDAASNVIGELRIPKLGLAAPIATGVGKIELIQGVGYIPGTAVAGGLGTMGLAGHRDTFFRPLRHIAPGMQIRVTGEGGTYRYVVDTTRVVRPEEVDVLETGSEPRLILVTCFPFHYIGAAPKRFIVQAHLVSLIPDSQ